MEWHPCHPKSIISQLTCNFKYTLGYFNDSSEIVVYSTKHLINDLELYRVTMPQTESFGINSDNIACVVSVNEVKIFLVSDSGMQLLVDLTQQTVESLQMECPEFDLVEDIKMDSRYCFMLIDGKIMVIDLITRAVNGSVASKHECNMVAMSAYCDPTKNTKIVAADEEGHVIVLNAETLQTIFETNIDAESIRFVVADNGVVLALCDSGLLLQFHIRDTNDQIVLEPQTVVDLNTLGSENINPIGLGLHEKTCMVALSSGVLHYDLNAGTANVQNRDNSLFSVSAMYYNEAAVHYLLVGCLQPEMWIVSQSRDNRLAALTNANMTKKTTSISNTQPEKSRNEALPNEKRKTSSTTTTTTSSPSVVHTPATTVTPTSELEPMSTHEADDQDDEVLSIFPSKDPSPDSPLLMRVENSRKDTPKTSQKSNKSKTSNKPVTFHRQIKSSGYGTTAPVQQMFGQKPRVKRSSSRAVDAAMEARLSGARMYPCDCSMINQIQSLDSTIDEKISHKTAITRIKYSSDATMLGTCSTDRTVSIIKLPLSKYKGDRVDITQHTENVNSVDFSHNTTLLPNNNSSSAKQSNISVNTQRPLILTASDDGTAMLWSTSMSAPLSIFRASNNIDDLTQPAKLQKRTPISQANFFYMDRYIVTTSKSVIDMHAYSLENILVGPSSDLKEQQRRNKQRTSLMEDMETANQRIVATWSFDGEAQSINAITMANSFLSHLIFTTRSDKSITIIDAAANRTLRFIDGNEYSGRAYHSIALPTSSLYTSHPPNAYDMFVTGSTDQGGCISIWDLRERNLVKTLTGHMNRVQSLAPAISPCMRYIATGSEDNSCYLYDIRMSNPVERLWDKHKDTVSDVAFHPVQPYLATACFDGRIRFYKSKQTEE